MFYELDPFSPLTIEDELKRVLAQERSPYIKAECEQLEIDAARADELVDLAEIYQFPAPGGSHPNYKLHIRKLR